MQAAIDHVVLWQELKTFTPAKLLYDEGFSVIDATIQQRENAYIMSLKNENDNPIEKNLRIATSKNLHEGYRDASDPITGNYLAEGPTMLKMGDRWLVYFDKYTEHRYGAIESVDLKTWTDVSEKITLPTGIRHGTIVQVNANELKRLKKL